MRLRGSPAPRRGVTGLSSEPTPRGRERRRRTAMGYPHLPLDTHRAGRRAAWLHVTARHGVRDVIVLLSLVASASSTACLDSGAVPGQAGTRSAAGANSAAGALAPLVGANSASQPGFGVTAGSSSGLAGRGAVMSPV